MTFDPSVTASSKLGLFGLPSTPETAKVHLIQVPWEVTTSYGGGTAQGPRAILEASPQIDLFDLELKKNYEAGYYLHPAMNDLEDLNRRMRPLALQVRAELEDQGKLSEEGRRILAEVNAACNAMVSAVHRQSSSLLGQNKLLGLIGGDHSTPEGTIRAHSEKVQGDFSILHIDAHADLRTHYQGFTHSHASIMNNVMNAEWRPQRLVQVGIRDFCEEEYDMIQKRPDIEAFFDLDLKRAQLSGESWAKVAEKIVDRLTDRVYLSFDIDGLSPVFCPNTGTPVPGGLTFDEALFLIGQVVRSGRKLIGFDLNEVAPSPHGDEWDGNVGSRILYKLCGWLVESHRESP